MKEIYLLKSSLRALRSNKSRTVLTLLGILIGVASIIMVMSLGKGAENLILGQIQGIGSKTIDVAPGRQPQGPADFASLFADSLKERDLELLMQKSNVPHLAEIMPAVYGSESVSSGGETYRTTIFGVTSLFTEIYDIYPAEGRNFTEEEIKGYGDVVIIGSKVKEELFDQNQALGEKIRIKGRNLRIIGIIAPKGQFSFINFDTAVIMPYTTAQQYIFGIKHFHDIIIQADSEENVSQTVKDIEVTLRNAHGITDPEKDDFYVQTQAQAMDMVSSITGVLTMFLVSIAAISLVVGGIGIMNIMLVSVTERTQEIGLRKALGATNKDIESQFLLESTLITVLGGTAGIISGTALSFLIALILSSYLGLDWGFVFPLGPAAIGFLVSALVGLIFGIYPARKASLKNPIEALRYE